jgi:hypothetical protein
MHLRHIHRKPVAVAAATMLALGAFAGTAVAVLSGSSGTSQLHMDNRGQTDPQTTNSIGWRNLNGADIPLAIHGSGLVNARFTAESICGGGGPVGCRVRIVALNIASGALVELDPASGMDFAFDGDVPNQSDKIGEGHAMERSRRLTAGSYQLRVQFAVDHPLTSFTLDDWHFAVETSA